MLFRSQDKFEAVLRTKLTTLITSEPRAVSLVRRTASNLSWIRPWKTSLPVITRPARACEKTPGTISFGTYPNAKISDVTAVTIDGKSPAAADYPYVGELALVFKEKNKTGNIAKFFEFIASPAAKDVIKGAGGLTL